MSKKQKLKLDDLKVQSFVTVISKHVKGGANPWTHPHCATTMWDECTLAKGCEDIEV